MPTFILYVLSLTTEGRVSRRPDAIGTCIRVVARATCLHELVRNAVKTASQSFGFQLLELPNSLAVIGVQPRPRHIKYHNRFVAWKLWWLRFLKQEAILPAKSVLEEVDS